MDIDYVQRVLLISDYVRQVNIMGMPFSITISILRQPQYVSTYHLILG